MITPAFDISQDADFLTITIKVPYARVSELDIYIDGDDFKFYAKPYFLRLTLPGRIVEDGRQKATYNADDGVFTVRVPKETPGQNFEGLNLLTSLLAPKGVRTAKHLVEEIGASNEIPEDDDEDFDWQIEQTPYEESPSDELGSQCTYGFGNLRVGVFGRLQEELNDVIDLRDPDVTPAAERTRRRLEAEKAKFDPDHYLADLFEDDAIKQLLRYKTWWVEIPDRAANVSQEGEDKRVTFTEKEKEQLRKFTNKSYLLDKRAKQLAYLGLIDVLLAYCYETRVTEGERNVESSWNIRKLSGTLCWFENYKSVKDVLVSFGRRVSCYPLYRNFRLVTKSVQDLISLLRLGKAAVLKCLLDIHSIFQENDPAYILNDLYITDYCIWIQKVKSKKVAALADSLQAAGLSKADLGLELEELEEAASLVQEEEKLLETAGSVPRQPAALITSETSSSSSSEYTSSDESDDGGSSSEESETKDSPETALLQAAEITTSQPSPTRAPVLVEDVTAHVAISAPQGHAADGSRGEKETGSSVRHPGRTEPEAPVSHFLEVTPCRNPLLIVQPPEDSDTSLPID
ncbi:PREDICTED: protein SHQ1 homolog [Nanorana parkeri]|uniref:protein SHQ1 homolog n=1 Tax=Nanorana parkeri TaxID=125878 RepID=UPI000854E280|nr:PREDICTED: protein SHQ1 homolog [Nanorana parkeri]